MLPADPHASLSFAGAGYPIRNAVAAFVLALSCASASAAEVAEGMADEAAAEELKWADLGDQQEIIVQQYVAAAIVIASAQLNMTQSLELKKQAGLVKAEIAALKDDSTVNKKKLKSYTKTSERTNKLIRKKLEKDAELTAAQRQEFTQGVITYAEGIERTLDVWNEAEPFARSVRVKAGETTAEIASKAEAGRWWEIIPIGEKGQKGAMSKFNTAMYITTSAPKLLGNHGSTMRQVIQYMRNNDLAVPRQATASLNKVGIENTEQGGSVWGNAWGALTKADKNTPPCPEAPLKYCLWLELQPVNARVVLLDVAPKYSPGISLPPGQHRVRVIADGFVTKTETLDLSKSSVATAIVLDRAGG